MGDRREEKDSSGRTWCAIIILAIVIAVIVIVVLALTVFRVRDPKITLESAQVRSFSLTFLSDGPHLSFTVDTVVAVKNDNHASFKYNAGTVYIYYHSVLIGQANVPAGKVGSESTTRIATEVAVDSSAFVNNQFIQGDVQAGVIPLVATTTLRGRVDVAGIVKHHATSVSNCNLNVYIQTQTVSDFSCSSKFNL